ncbi:MAG: Mur ligase family protein [Chloroflexi bacterium]|nr:Mur ligase family protein [Chloroflexota bacterium]MCL5074248.1 Mur ligase family protein [Chloroflexota bacterium]
MVQIRLTAAVITVKLTAHLIRRLKVGGGTTLPGSIARRLDPQCLAKMVSRLRHGCIVVTGTNGKTTTARMTANILHQAGYRPVHNRAGANLISGVTSALLETAGLTGTPRADIGIFEVDEATLPTAIEEVQPKIVVITNLFRDQLDRYGEIDYLATIWKESLEQLPSDSAVILNADDPTLAWLGRELKAKVIYYGLEDERWGRSVLEHTADSKICLHCRTAFEYKLSYYSHMGKYHCPKCAWTRPRPHIQAVQIEMYGSDRTICQIRYPEGALTINVNVPGLYNVYNALAAFGCGLALSVPSTAIKAGIESFHAAFGRIERLVVDGRTIFLALVKNPVGFNQVLRTIFANNLTKKTLIIINDNIADGTDISWLWDVDFEMMTDKVALAIISGTRAEDMAVRLKYASVDPSRFVLEQDVGRALQEALQNLEVGETLYVLPTYTAMLEVREVLQQMGYVKHFWQD